MSKGLEALKEVKKYYPFKVNELENLNIDIIETSLKKYEELTSKPIVLCGRTHKHTQALIDYICKNYKEVKITNFEDEKKLKALEIIKNNLNWHTFLDYAKGCFTEKEYDLLKEVML